MVGRGLLMILGLVFVVLGVWFTTRETGRDEGHVATPDPTLEARADEPASLELGGAAGEPAQVGVAEPTTSRPAAEVAERRSHMAPERRLIPLRLIDDRGVPVPEIQVEWRLDGSHDSSKGTFATQDGDLDFEVSGPGRWHVTPFVLGHVRETKGRFLSFDVPYEGERRVVRFLRPGTVTGRVVDEDGRPFPGLDVVVDEENDRRGVMTTADEYGAFEVSVSPGSKQAHVDSAFEKHTIAFELTPGGEAEIQFVIPAGGFIQGTVYDKEGELVDEGGVMFSMDIELGGGEIDEDGTFLLGPLPPDVYTIFAVYEVDDQPVVLPPLEVEVTAGNTVEVILRPHQQATHRLEGRVLLGQEALPNCRIMAFDEGAGLLEGFHGTKSDEEGRYAFELGRASTYIFLFEPENSPRGDPTAPQRVLVDGDLHEFDFHLALGEIRGRVLNPEGIGQEGAEVIAFREDGYLDQLLPFEEGSTRTQTDGTYRLPFLAEGLYTVMAFGKDAYHKRTGVHVNARTVEGIDLPARPKAYVNGRVIDGEGNPVEKAGVFARDEDGTILWGHKDDTGKRGTFGIPVPAGKLTFFARLWGAASQESDPITIAPGAKVEDLELRVLPSGRLRVLTTFEDVPAPASLRVFDAEGRDVSRAQVTFDGMAGVLGDPLSVADQRIGPLPPGTYRVEATSPSGQTARKTVKMQSDDLEVKLRF